MTNQEKLNPPTSFMGRVLIHHAECEGVTIEQALRTALEQSLSDTKNFLSFLEQYRTITGKEPPSYDDLKLREDKDFLNYPLE